jgi:uncharacterized protein (DUF302 family)
MAEETTRYGITRTVDAPYAETVERVRSLLRDEGFGVLTEIDVQRTLKEKLGRDIEPYVILGACNPPLAARALELEPDIGLLLPCNVVVARRGARTFVGAVYPQSLVEFAANPELEEVARQADERLRRVVAAV